MRILKIKNYTIKQGTNIVLPVILEGATGDEVAITFSVQFDPKVLAFNTKVQLGPDIPSDSGHMYNFTRILGGVLGFELDSLNNYAKNPNGDVIIYLRFKVLSTMLKTTQIKFVPSPVIASLSNVDAVLLPLTTSDSTLFIS